MEKTLEFRGLKQSTIIDYILSIVNLSLSHIITKDDESVTIKKSNWSITVSQEERYYFTETFSYPRLFVTFQGDEGFVEDVIKRLRTKTTRIGG